MTMPTSVLPTSVVIVDRVPHSVFNGVSRYMEEIARRAGDFAGQTDARILCWGLQMSPQNWQKRNYLRREFPAKLNEFNRRYLYHWGKRRSQADLLHFPAHGIPAHWLETTKKCLLSVHGAAAQVAPEWDSDPVRHQKLRRSMNAAKEASAWFVTFSEFAKSEIVGHYQLDPARIAVIPHGVDHQHCRPIPEPQLAAFKRANKLDRPYFLYVGPCAPRKNVGRMIEAFARAKERSGAPHQFIIAGRYHPHQDTVGQQIADLGLEDSVRLIGPVSHADLSLLYNGADAFAFVSLYEGFGLPVLEAMACGTPVITNAKTATGEVAGEAAAFVADAGDVDEIADQMARLMEDESHRKRLKSAGLKRAQNYSWDKSAKAHFALYEEIIQADV